MNHLSPKRNELETIVKTSQGSIGNIVYPNDLPQSTQRKSDTVIGERGELKTDKTIRPSKQQPPRWSVWRQKLQSILFHNIHAGDFRHRTNEAFRAALGSLILFASLLDYFALFPSLWIGNIFHHAVITKESVGGIAPFSKDIVRTLILVMCLSWPVNLLLLQMNSLVFAILFPFFTGILSFIIMLCPWLALKNLMLLYMYLVIQSGCRAPAESRLYPVQLAATCTLGCFVSILVMLLPLPKPSLAVLKVKHCLKNVQHDSELMLAGVESFMAVGGANLRRTRRAVSSIELAIEKMDLDIAKLKNNVEAAQWELHAWRFLRLKCFSNQEPQDILVKWIEVLTRQQEYSKMIKFAVMQRLLGEGTTNYHQDLKDAKLTLSMYLKDCMAELIQCTRNSMAFCNSTVQGIPKMPINSRFVQAEEDLEMVEHIRNDNVKALEKTKAGLDQALDRAETLIEVQEDRNHHELSTPAFAFIIRRIQLCHGLFAYSEEISTFLQESFAIRRPEKPKRNAIVLAFLDLYNFFTQPWPKYSREAYHLPLKAALGMSIASLFVAIPHLYDLAKPNAMWPGLTVASVNLSTTGSSFVKAVDRLRGTLIASAFALLLSELLGAKGDLTNNWIKIPALTVFTFIAIYLKDPAHSYEYTYAATSIGSMLYGSVAFDYNLHSYIPKRIAFIFMGVLIFSFVETFVFPRSSKEIVQRSCLKFFRNMKGYLDTAAISMNALSLYVPINKQEAEWTDSLDNISEREDDFHESDPTVYVSSKNIAANSDSEDTFDLNAPVGGGRDIDQLEKHSAVNAEVLKGHLMAVRKAVTTSKKELDSALTEPYWGFELQMNPHKFKLLMSLQSICQEQAGLLFKIINGLQALYLKNIQQTNPLLHNLDWPKMFAAMIREASGSLEKCVMLLEAAYPDHRLRPQNNNSELALQAGIMFRNFEDIRLGILLQWSNKYKSFLKLRNASMTNLRALLSKSQSEVKIASLEIRVYVAIAESIILEICRQLQKAGKVVEEIAHDYPRFENSHVLVQQSDRKLFMSP